MGVFSFNCLIISFITSIILIKIPTPISATSDVVQFDINIDTPIGNIKKDAILARDTSTVASTVKDTHSEDFPFSIKFSLGTPEQSFIGALSNRHSGIYVNNKNSNFCASPYSKYYCSKYGSYDSSSSSSFDDSDNQLQLTSTPFVPSNGTFVFDKLKFGGIEIDNIPVAVFSESTSSKPIFGIGFPGLNQYSQTDINNNNVNIPSVLKNKGLTKSLSYSICPSSKDSFYKGSILFGGIDKAKFEGNLIPFNITFDDEKYELIDVEMRGVTNSASKDRITSFFTLSFNLGSFISIFPRVVMEEVLKVIPYEYDLDLGHYVGKCMTTERYFTFNDEYGREFILNLQDLIAPLTTSFLSLSSSSTSSSRYCYLLAEQLNTRFSSPITLGISVFL